MPRTSSSKFWRSPWAPRAVALLICLAVFGAIALTRRAGGLEFLELKTYDLLVAAQPKDTSYSDRIVVVGVTEPDIQNKEVGFPIPDAVMGRLVEIILAGDARAVGIDIFRDIPVPAGGEGREALRKVLADRRVVTVTKYDNTGTFIGAPPEAKASQVGFADFPRDKDGRVRRAMMFFSDAAGVTYQPLALRLATRFLRAEDASIRLEPVPDAPDTWFRLGKVDYRPLGPSDGAYVRAETGGTQVLFDFKGAVRYEPIPVTDVLEGKVSAQTFAGKVVVIGMTAPDTVKDFISTGQETDQFGPEVHAVLADQLIRGALTGQRPPRVWPDPAEYAWTLGWALLGGVLGLFVRRPVTFVPALIVSVAALLAAVTAAFVLAGYWIPSLPPLLGCVAAAGFVTQYMSHHERSERFVLNELFKRSVDADVAETLWARRDELLDEGQLVAKQVRATVLFTDLEGFTTITEAMDKSALMALLNDYIAVMSDCVSRRPDAFVNKYIGDAVMAVFGPPLERTVEQARADARNAVECALEMRASLEENRERWERACLEGIRKKRDAEGGGDGTVTLPDVTLRMRIGIQSGIVTAGSLGSRQRLEYTVIGDTVNTAARLEAFQKNMMPPDLAAGGCRILLGQDTLDLLPPGEYLTREVGSIQLKGKAQMVTIHGVIGRAAPTHGGPADRAKVAGDVETVAAK